MPLFDVARQHNTAVYLRNSKRTHPSPPGDTMSKPLAASGQHETSAASEK